MGSPRFAAVWSQISLNLLYSHALEITTGLVSGIIFFFNSGKTPAKQI